MQRSDKETIVFSQAVHASLKITVVVFLYSLLYGELAEGSRPVRRPRLRYKDICKRVIKLSGIDVNKWESYVDAYNRAKWRTTVREGVMRAEERRRAEQENKRRRRKQRETSSSSPTNYRCSGCGKDGHFRISLQSHSQKCRKT